MKGLIGCEESGIVRRAFLARGYDVYSCDLKPAADGSNRHYRCDVRELLDKGWDFLFIAHPPCTRLCNSGVRWLHVPPPGRSADDMQAELRAGADLFSDCWNADIPCVGIENPVMHRHAKVLIRNFEPHTQSVQPWQFGDAETKRTCLWLKGLPPLVPTIVEKPSEVAARVWRMPPGPNRQAERSKFFPGIAAAMADQWGPVAMGRAAA